MQLKSPKKHSNILVVEDNQADIWLLREAIAFHKVPVELRVIQDGQSAIEFLQQTDNNLDGACPEVVLLDLNLPKISGREVLRCLRSQERWEQVPVVIMTSSDSPRDRAEMSQLGATLYFQKPADFNEFLQIGDKLNQLLKTNTGSEHHAAIPNA